MVSGGASMLDEHTDPTTSCAWVRGAHQIEPRPHPGPSPAVRQRSPALQATDSRTRPKHHAPLSSAISTAPTPLPQSPRLSANEATPAVTIDGGSVNPSASVSRGIDKAGSWDWKLKEKHCTYHALFPRAWTVYDGEPDAAIKITCHQILPIIPHNYMESSFPFSVFTFMVQNSRSTPADVTLLFTWAVSAR